MCEDLKRIFSKTPMSVLNLCANRRMGCWLLVAVNTAATSSFATCVSQACKFVGKGKLKMRCIRPCRTPQILDTFASTVRWRSRIPSPFRSDTLEVYSLQSRSTSFPSPELLCAALRLMTCP